MVGGRSAQIFDAELRRLAAASVPGEFSDVPHVRGTLSMGRFDDPNSGTSSFSMLLGRAAHLDHTYAVRARVRARGGGESECARARMRMRPRKCARVHVHTRAQARTHTCTHT